MAGLCAILNLMSFQLFLVLLVVPSRIMININLDDTVDSPLICSFPLYGSLIKYSIFFIYS